MTPEKQQTTKGGVQRLASSVRLGSTEGLRVPSDPGHTPGSLRPSTVRLPGGATNGAPRSLRSGQHLFWEGHPASEIWSISQGSLKTYRLSNNGIPHVTGFFFAGGTIGWEGLVCGSFLHNAVALEPTVLVRFPAADVLDGVQGSRQGLAQLLDGVRSKLLRLETVLLLSHCSADQRLAVFLLWLAESQQESGADFRLVRLPMRRIDVGSYLCLATETVIRHLKSFHEQGLISLSRRAVIINDLPRLQRLARI